MIASRCAITAACIGLAPLSAQAQAPVTDAASLDARLARIERTLGSSSLLEMHETVQRLRREVRELRGEIELQANEIRKLRESQRQLYSDLDGRIAAAGPASPPSSGEPAQGSAPAVASPPPAPPPRASLPTTPPARLPRASADPAAEQRAYQEAFALLKGGKYEQASSAFAQFLQDHPNGRYADNAQYWLGESYYVSRKFEPAMKAFEQLVAEFPDSPKRGHALLKIGFIHDESGRKDQARQVLESLIAADPSSTAAGLARKRLARLQ